MGEALTESAMTLTARQGLCLSAVPHLPVRGTVLCAARPCPCPISQRPWYVLREDFDPHLQGISLNTEFIWGRLDSRDSSKGLWGSREDEPLTLVGWLVSSGHHWAQAQGTSPRGHWR